MISPTPDASPVSRVRAPSAIRTLLLALLLLSGLTFAIIAQAEKPTGPRMATAASTFLQSLPADKRTQAQYPFESAERTAWHFVPLQDKNRNSTRKGVKLQDMSDAQRAAALELLKTGLSPRGYTQATGIMQLETILAELEPNGANVRNPNWYFVTIFGEPSNTGRWGWRVEGHHCSINLTIDKGVVVGSSPIVFATNPATIKEGPKKGTRVLGDTEDAYAAVRGSLTPEQDKLARQSKPFAEIAATTRAAVNEPVGVPAGQLSDAQKEKLRGLVDVYLQRLPAEVAALEWQRIKAAGEGAIHFAYSHEAEKPGQPFTYRVQGPTFVIEFLNVQADAAKNPANHFHTGWRRLPKDFALE
ncbi:MAG: DUF3500 domain-containing protein [Gemmataceae bacterium]